MALNILKWGRRYVTLQSILSSLSENSRIAKRLYSNFASLEDSADESLSEYMSSILRYGVLLTNLWQNVYSEEEYNTYFGVDNDVKLPQQSVPLERIRMGSKKRGNKIIIGEGSEVAGKYKIGGTIENVPSGYNDRYSFPGVSLNDFSFSPDGVHTTEGTYELNYNYSWDIRESMRWDGVSLSDFTGPDSYNRYSYTYDPSAAVSSDAYIWLNQDSPINTEAIMDTLVSDVNNDGIDTRVTLENDQKVVYIESIQKQSGTTYQLDMILVPNVQRKWITLRQQNDAIVNVDSAQAMLNFSQHCMDNQYQPGVLLELQGDDKLLHITYVNPVNGKSKQFKIDGKLYTPTFVKYKWEGMKIGDFDQSTTSPVVYSHVYDYLNPDDFPIKTTEGVIVDDITMINEMAADVDKELILLEADGAHLKIKQVIAEQFAIYEWYGISLTDFYEKEDDELAIEMAYDINNHIGKALYLVDNTGKKVEITTVAQMNTFNEKAVQNEAYIILMGDMSCLRVKFIDHVNAVGSTVYYVVCSEYEDIDEPEPPTPAPKEYTLLEWRSRTIGDFEQDNTNGIALLSTYNISDIRCPLVCVYDTLNGKGIKVRELIDTEAKVEKLIEKVKNIRIRLSDGTMMKVFNIIRPDMNYPSYVFYCSVVAYNWAETTVDWARKDALSLENDIKSIVDKWSEMSPKQYFEAIQEHRDHLSETINVMNSFVSMVQGQGKGQPVNSGSVVNAENINNDYSYYNQ